MRVVSFAMLVLVVAGCGAQQQAADVVDTAAIVEELTAQQMAYAAAWSAIDLDAISTMWSHDDDITLWEPAERARIMGWSGPNGVRAWYENAMSTMAQIDFKVHDLYVKVNAEGNAAVMTYYVENDYVDLDGNAGEMTPRVTVVKVKQNGEWRIVHSDATFSIAEIGAMN